MHFETALTMKTLKDRLDAIEDRDGVLQLIYEWVKTDHIDLRQFKVLVLGIV